MKIAIIGGGSIGLLMTYFLKQRYEVCLYVRTLEQKNLILKEGIIYKQGEKKHTVKINVNTFDDWKGEEDFTIVTVKQYHLPSILDKFNNISLLNTSLLFLQNGMGHLKFLDSLNCNHIYVGVVEHGVYREFPNTVNHAGSGIVRIALYKGKENSNVHKWMDNQQSFFELQYTENYKEMLQKKLVVNAIINPLTAIFQIYNGELLKNPYYYKLMEALFEEVVMLIKIDRKEYFQNVLNVCNKTANNKSSMLKDLEENRPTEVDSILGYLLEVASNKKKKTPIIESYFHAIKGKEYERKGK